VKVYVGNLPFSMGDEELRGLFEAHGDVNSASVVMDRETGRSRGFGFVEMADDATAKKCHRSVDRSRGRRTSPGR